MEITSTAPHGSKSSEPEPDTPIRIQPGKPFTNGVLKRHRPEPPSPAVVTYRECLKNHVAGIGGHALDGCGEFMPSPSSNSADPTSLKCAACGCHRNFHRRDPDDSPQPPPPTPASAVHAFEYHHHHRHHPPPPPRSPSSASPPPISSSYAPHMLLALSSGLASGPQNPPPAVPLPHPTAIISPNPGSSRKRFRTKFSHAQKEKMFEFAKQVGWRIQRRDENLIREFCSEVGVDRNVLKVWIHNNKSTFTRQNANPNTSMAIGIGDGHGPGVDDDRTADPHIGTNGSSSSS